ncbi:Hypothetical protein SCF082_LOCUS8001 [Durusdinium trenchii]|uniref:RGS domain-containing protein n=1 Tax=Durusdinium trenchii TaxID=1381693 RepID=A0ABP0IN38_9DINO
MSSDSSGDSDGGSDTLSSCALTSSSSTDLRSAWTFKLNQVSLYRCLTFLGAIFLIILSSLGALLLGTCKAGASFACEIDATPQYADMNLCILMACTAVAACGAIWVWCHASTPHLLQASRFLVLNWIEGLASTSLIIAAREYYDDELTYYYGDGGDALTVSVLGSLRVFLLVCEIVILQVLIQNRLQSIWPALNQPRFGVWLNRFLWAELALLTLGPLTLIIGATHRRSELGLILVYIAIAALVLLIPCCFVIWMILVFATLCRVLYIFNAAQQMAQEGSLESGKALRRSRRAALLQGLGLVISLATTSIFTGVAVSTVVGYEVGQVEGFELQGVQYVQCVNLVTNTIGVILLSGAYRFWGVSSLPSDLPKDSGPTGFGRFRFKSRPVRPKREVVGTEWEAKTQELAGRGLSLQHLLSFYRSLGNEIMLSYRPDVHTTNDVVRLAIIPITARHGTSYAQLVNRGEPAMPRKMVTHNWSNLFRDLLASVVADALEEHTFELVSALLSDEVGINALEQMIRLQGTLGDIYWICAFAVNQHSGICGANPRADVDPVTMLLHPVCSCRTPKFFNTTPPLNPYGESIPCEMNKFDDMMSFLACKDPSFAELVAVDASLELFSRAWCMAELAEAQRMGMAQSLLVRNKATLLSRQHTLEGLRVQDMKASRPEDVDTILAKIPNKDAFNQRLRSLILDRRVGLLTAWKQADSLQQTEQLSHVLKWARLSTAVTDGLPVWQNWV